ncbi:MAG: lysophospholipid acyltransferase family protein [Frankia sp.]
MAWSNRDGGPGGAGLRDVARGWRWGGRTLVPGSAEPHRVTSLPREFTTSWARTPAARATRSAAQAYALAPLLRSQLSMSVYGAETLAELSGPAVFVANHSSHLDAPLLLCALPSSLRDRTAVTAAADYFFGSMFRAVSTALVFGTVPIERRGGAPSTTPVDLLADGWNLVIFPEGTRSADGMVGRFRFGAAQLALTQGVPIIPVGIRGSYAAMPRGRSWPKPGRPPVTIRFGRPLHPRPGDDLRELTGRVSDEVARLLDEDATTWWDAVRRPADTSGAAGTPLSGTLESHDGAAGSGAAGIARWRRVWAATEPTEPSGPRSPWD